MAIKAEIMENITQLQKVEESRPLFNPIVIGYIVMIFVILTWSGFSLTVRAINSSPLTTAEVALIRFFIPLLLLLPFIPSRLEKIKKIRFTECLLILLGGIPFFFFAALGAKTAPTAYMGAILAGTVPFFVAILSWVFYRQLFSKKQVFTLSLIIGGVLVMVLGQTSSNTNDILQGVMFLFCGSLVWAGFTLGIKQSRLDAISIALILTIPSFFIMLFIILLGLMPSNMAAINFSEALPFILIQGCGTGFIAVIGYSYAVKQLGSEKASIIGSLSPSITALLAVPIFNEPLSFAIIFGIVLTTSGVILSNLISRR